MRQRQWLRKAVYAVVAGALIVIYFLVSHSDSLASGRGSPVGQTVPVSLTVKATLQRPNSPAPNAAWSVPMTLGLYAPGDASSPVCLWEDLRLDQTGAYSGALGIAPDTYDVRVKSLHTLRNVKRNVTITPMTTIDMGILLEGDADNDNRVRASDFALLGAAYFTVEGDARFDPRSDFDEDNRIRSSDFALLRENYFRTGDIEVGAAGTAAGLGARAVSRPAGSVALALEPGIAQVAPGDTVTLTLTAHAGEQAFTTLDVDIRFPPAFLQVVRPDAATATAIQVLPPVDNVLMNQVDNTGGRILYAAGTRFSGSPVRGDVPLAQIRFKARAATIAAPVRLVDATVSAQDGMWVTGPLTGATIQIGTDIRRHYLPLMLRS